MKRTKPLAMAIAAGVIVAIALVAGVAAFASGGGDTPVNDDEPVDSGDGAAVPDAPPHLLHDARLDLAGRLDLDPLADVQLASLEVAGWDGCLGVYEPDTACTEQFIAGAIAHFEAEGERYRYHLGDGRFIATDFVEGDVQDGMDVQSELRPDTVAMMNRYVRGDLALRKDVEPAEITTTVLAPVTFSDGCLGFEEGSSGCDDALVPGAIVLLEYEGEEARYHVSQDGGVIPVSFTGGQATIDVNQNVREVQQDMREDAASELDIAADAVSIDSFRIVDWPDGCLGVHQDGSVCTEAVVEDGFIAFLVADGKSYRYHGSPDEFIGIEFLDGDVRIGEPLPPDEGTTGGEGDSGDSIEEDSGAYNPEGNSELPQALVADLAATLEVDPSDIEVRSFEEVTWPDGCMGIYHDGTVCTQALVPGYIAELEHGDEAYRYFGSGSDFTNVTLLDGDGVRIGEPIDQ